MIVIERIKRVISMRKDDVFVRTEFDKFGSEAQVSRVLRSLVSSGRLIKLGVGVYAKTQISVLSGKPIPSRPVSVLAPIALKKLGVVTFPSRLTQEYNSGATTQLPAGNVLNTGTRRISRKIASGNQFITYEKNKRVSKKTH